MTSANSKTGAAMARIDQALGRLEGALAQALQRPGDSMEAARHEKLRKAVGGALGQLDALIAAQNSAQNGGDAAPHE